jgi:hypothetical protein
LNRTAIMRRSRQRLATACGMTIPSCAAGGSCSAAGIAGRGKSARSRLLRRGLSCGRSREGDMTVSIFNRRRRRAMSRRCFRRHFRRKVRESRYLLHFGNSAGKPD